MKYIILLGDGMADLPVEQLNNKTPLESANKPYMNNIAALGEMGLVKTVPEGYAPGSDVANLSVMGYDPTVYYTGRSTLEAIGMGIDVRNGDCTFRCNLVSLAYGDEYENAIMLDYSAGEISTRESAVLIHDIQKELGDSELSFFPGISYRHCLTAHKDAFEVTMTPPHDITNQNIAAYLPSGNDGEKFLTLQKASRLILENHPINQKRIAGGLRPANSIWLWGQGTKPSMPLYKKEYNMQGAVITAVDLIKGIAKCAGMKIYEVEGATGNIHTNFIGKANAAVQALTEGADMVYLHIEAPDECGHQGDVQNKVKSIEIIDSVVLKTLLENVDVIGNFRLLCLPDHPTPLALMTHTSEPVPYILYDITKENSKKILEGHTIEGEYTEDNAKKTGIFYASGPALFKRFISM